ncbi:MAG: hypothetical protein KDA22_03545 [Phycisphaerales bacterium]|nr:hypothetical protein [Phycisphaerales bacterium]
MTIGTTVFEDLLKLEAEQRGMPGLTYLLVEHPLGGIRPDAVRAKALAAVDALEAALLGGR